MSPERELPTGTAGGGWPARVARWLRPDPERRRAYGWAAAVLFLLVAVGSAWRLPPLELRWGWLGAATLLVPVTLSLVVAEYRVAGWLLGRSVGWEEAFKVTVFSSAANLLPVPGGLVVRTEALRRKGSGLGPALGSNVVVGLGWLGAALLLAGILLHGEGSRPVVLGFVAGGIFILAAMLMAIQGIRAERGLVRSAGGVVGLEALYVLVSALRLQAVLWGIGIESSFSQALTLTVARALAAGVGFFPGGLGLRELLAGGLAPLAGMAPAVGAFSTVVDRVVGMSVLGAVAVAVWLVWKPGGEGGAENPEAS